MNSTKSVKMDGESFGEGDEDSDSVQIFSARCS